ncbi:MAG: choloylglycine hydrolase [Clostridia bacterium]|nr:choloylglycine hydrolase [Clostridia bacterium]
MCTAATYKTKDHYFGRTLDWESSFNENVTVTPRNFTFKFRKVDELLTHYAIIGVAVVSQDYPMYFDATNEKGLSMAGLNFPDNAVYKAPVDGMDNIAPFEFIPWILGQCSDVSEAEMMLKKINLVDINFSNEFPLSPLHWIIADSERSITVEPLESGLKVYNNPVGVLTNNPPFDFHMLNLCHYMGVSKNEPENRFSEKLSLSPYSRGMGAVGLPGDLSSASRFVKATFTKMNSVSDDTEKESISQFFHILSSVEQQRGCVDMGDEKYEITLYTSCCNTNKGIYYYTTYENRQISGIDMHKENLDGDKLISYPMITTQQINIQN